MGKILEEKEGVTFLKGNKKKKGPSNSKMNTDDGSKRGKKGRFM